MLVRIDDLLKGKSSSGAEICAKPLTAKFSSNFATLNQRLQKSGLAKKEVFLENAKVKGASYRS